MSSEEVKKRTRQTLGKYSSTQLIAKLEATALFGLSKTIAIEILELRKQDVSKYKGETYIKPGSAADPHKEVKEAVEETATQSIPIPNIPTTTKTETPKKEKSQKIKKAKSEPIDEEDSKIKDILISTELTKTKKIKAFFELGYSCSQIASSSLNAHLSFCHSVKATMKAAQKE